MTDVWKPESGVTLAPTDGRLVVRVSTVGAAAGEGDVLLCMTERVCDNGGGGMIDARVR